MAKKPLKIISATPVGTREELAKLRLSPAQYGSCSAPEKSFDGTDISLGCPFYDECELRTRSGLWPRNGGVRFVKTVSDGSRKVVQWRDTCFGYMARKEDFDAKGPYEWVADEGEELREVGSVPRDENIPGQGMVRIIEDRVLTHKIEPFKRPGDSEALVQQAFANEIAEDVAAKKRAKRAENPLGLDEQVEKNRTRK